MKAVASVPVLLAACAVAPREPIVHQPTSAQARMVPAPAQPAARGAIYRGGVAQGSWALFEDSRPRNVGDVLTILVTENSRASKSSAANASRDGEVGLGLDAMPRFLGNLLRDQGAEASASHALNAKGGANASNSFQGVITVTVIDVLANGNLLVSGEKQMLINQGTEFIRFSGVVDPRSVRADNTVASTQVADARVEYSARGYIDEAQTMGWLQRIFLNVMPY